MRNTLNQMHAALPPAVQQATSWMRVTLMPSIGVAAVNLSALVICVGAVVCLKQLVEPFPVERVELVSVEPQDHVIDRSQFGALAIVRRIVMRRTATVQVIRTWVDPGQGVTSTLDDYLLLEKGDNMRSRVNVPAPSTLNPGPHRYRVALRWCNALKCEAQQLEDIEVMIVGVPPTTRGGYQDHRF